MIPVYLTAKKNPRPQSFSLNRLIVQRPGAVLTLLALAVSILCNERINSCFRGTIENIVIVHLQQEFFTHFGQLALRVVLAQTCSPPRVEA